MHFVFCFSLNSLSSDRVLYNVLMRVFASPGIKDASMLAATVCPHVHGSDRTKAPHPLPTKISQKVQCRIVCSGCRATAAASAAAAADAAAAAAAAAAGRVVHSLTTDALLPLFCCFCRRC